MSSHNPTQTTADSAALVPEYEPAEIVGNRFGWKRSTTWELIRLGKIKSISLKTRAGNIRGRRLVNVASVRGYLESLAQ